jgi:hypothetical protein
MSKKLPKRERGTYKLLRVGSSKQRGETTIERSSVQVSETLDNGSSGLNGKLVVRLRMKTRKNISEVSSDLGTGQVHTLEAAMRAFSTFLSESDFFMSISANSEGTSEKVGLEGEARKSL